MPVDIPVLETERLILRGRKLEDFPAFHAMWSDPEVVKHICEPLTKEEAWTKIARMEGFWSLTGYGLWAVEEKSSGAFLGEVGPADFNRDITPSLEGKIEFGWNLVARAQGRGYATEALRATLDWAGRNLPRKTYCCIISIENVSSVRLAEKCGFKEAARTEYRGEPTIIFERTPI